MTFDIKTALTSIAPTLAAMLGGPLAGVAVSALETATGLAPGSGQEAITKIVQGAGMTPNILASIQAQDAKHAEILTQQKIDILKINTDHAAAMAQITANDRASARTMQESTRSYTAPAMAWLVILSSISLSIAIVSGWATRDGSASTLLGAVVGYAFSESKLVLAYFFGGSSTTEK